MEGRGLKTIELRGFRLRFCTRSDFCTRCLDGFVSRSIPNCFVSCRATLLGASLRNIPNGRLTFAIRGIRIARFLS